jgi:serine protease Do
MRLPLHAPNTLALTLAFCVALGCQRANAAGAQPTSRNGGTNAARNGQLLPLPSPALARATADGKGASIADVVEKVVPSVVSISSTRVARTQQMPLDDPFFRFFFGPGHGGGGPREEREQGLGSGVIVGDGLVVTNNHVIDHADEIKIATLDRRQFDAELIGADPKTDLALLRIKGNTKRLKPIALGDSGRLRLGDVVLAVGNPFGVGQTVTMGIVSAKNRSDLGIEDYEDFIQTDAAINPGNSGGALVDMEGNLIGINTAILSRSGGNVGIGFAIPSNMARPIVDSLLQHGKVVRGWLGVAIQPLDPDMSKALNLPENSGVLVSDVTKDTPAAKAGVRRGDVIMSVDDIKVRTTGELRNAIAAYGATKTVRLRILRDGKEIIVPVALAEMPGKFADSNAAGNPSAGKSAPALGMELQSLTPDLKKKLDVPAEINQGVVITDMDSRSEAARAGLRPGDVVLELNRTKLATPADLQRIWQSSKGNLLALVLRKGTTNYVVIKRTG